MKKKNNDGRVLIVFFIFFIIMFWLAFLEISKKDTSETLEVSYVSKVASRCY